MCIIIEKREEDVITRAWMATFHQNNRDGWGIMYQPAPGARPEVIKGMGFKPLWRAHQSIKEHAQIIHLRMATHGPVNDDMSHPFMVIPGTYLVHNGIIDAPVESVDKSDTCHLVELVLRPMLEGARDPAEFIRSDGFRYFLESHMGASNRIVMMDALGHVVFNPTAWHTLPSGMRVSNTYAWHSPDAGRYPKPITARASGFGFSDPWDSAYSARGWSHGITPGIRPSAPVTVAEAREEDEYDDDEGDEFPDYEDIEAQRLLRYELAHSSRKEVLEFVYSEPEEAARLLMAIA